MGFALPRTVEVVNGKCASGKGTWESKSPCLTRSSGGTDSGLHTLYSLRLLVRPHLAALCEDGGELDCLGSESQIGRREGGYIARRPYFDD